MKPKTREWLARAAEDMAIADFAWESSFVPSCLFHLQQAIEKVLKAALIESTGDYPKTHDLPDLVARLGLDLSPEQMKLLRRLSEQYIPTRYADPWIEIPGDVADNYYRGTKELYSWLLQQLS